MAAIVHMAKPVGASFTFADYIAKDLLPYINQRFTDKTSRIDAVWDQYPEGGLKALTQFYRGSGTRTMLDPAGSAPIPRGETYERFLHNTENKRQFFSFSSKQLCYHLSLITEKLIITTDEEKVISNHDLDLSMLQPCNHAEAETRIILHLFHAASEGHKFAPWTVMS